MQIFAVLLSLSLTVIGSPFSRRAEQEKPSSGQQIPSSVRQLCAVRGEVVKITAPAKGSLLITIKPAKQFSEVTVLARVNDLVGSAVGREGSDLLGLLSDEPRDDETITAAELNEGDVISVIYDPQLQNRVLEIYLH
jgi:hypothetical protein